jgi:pSer/pThr/pTyr-binding forkhead associated (FHA) protein
MDLFSEACGAAGTLVVDLHEQGRAEPTRRAFRQPFLLAGRHIDADVPLLESTADRRHAYLQTLGGRVYFVDLDSRQADRAGGSSTRSTWLDPRRPVRIGPIALSLRGDERGEAFAGDVDPPSPLSPEFARRMPLPGAILEVRAEEGKSLLWRMEPALALLGRSPSCSVRLQHPTVSAFHCSLVRTPKGVWVVDLLSRKGVVVDGKCERCFWVADGGEFRLGPFSIRLRYDTPGHRSALPAVSSRGLSASRDLAGRVTGPALAPVPAADDSPQGLAPVLEQVAQMQGQMFDQFKQVMAVMAQTFSAMHQDHMEFVRHELAQIRRLTDEMQDLRARWEQSHSAALDQPRPRSRKSLPPLALGAIGLAEGPPARLPGGGWDGLPEPTNGDHDGGGLKDPKEVEAFVSERLAAYERERQSCWNRIVRVVTSLRSDD